MASVEHSLVRYVKRVIVSCRVGVVCRKWSLCKCRSFPVFWCTLAVLGIIVLCKTLLDHPPSIHVQCDCGEVQATGERVARYLPGLMTEVDILTNRTAVDEIEQSHPSLAIQFLVEVEAQGSRCSTTPSLFSIKHGNVVWQEGKVGGATFFIYGAYWDHREETGAVVRVLVMTDTARPPTPYCLFHTHTHLSPTSTKATRLDYVHWQDEIPGEWLPYLVTCMVGPAAVLPRAVSLVGNQCANPTNAMRIHNIPTHTNKHSFPPHANKIHQLPQPQYDNNNHQPPHTDITPQPPHTNKKYQSPQAPHTDNHPYLTQPPHTGNHPHPPHSQKNLSPYQKNSPSYHRKNLHPHTYKSTITQAGKKNLASTDLNLLRAGKAYSNEHDFKFIDKHKEAGKETSKLEEGDSLTSNVFRANHMQDKLTSDNEYQEKALEPKAGVMQESSTKRQKKNLALCHKFLFNPTRDFSLRLVEWMEAALAWGVDSITFYMAAVHPNVTKVLHHYQSLGYVTLLPWASPGHLPSLPHLYRALFDTQRYVLFTTENIPYTDCLLRHINSHRYVAVWDMDEFILPASQFNSLVDMVDAAKSRANYQGLKPVSYLARCAYYFDNLVEPSSPSLPRYLNLLRHVTRTAKYTPMAVFTKSIHDTQYALGLHAHFALVSVRGEIDRNRDLYHMYPGSEAHLAHYRSQCQGEDQTECQLEYRPYLIRDTTMWRYRERIVAKTTEALLHLGLIHD